ncbi:hypothetical protein L484_004970 [Morus notabilis]|uniref:Uncharacterized protein n=1 Tax=Morus notabilis TaxID=981085 RepID=W9S6F7_9ROSA|nr:hypothetical protein L484_004970 [Morus notabilis]
MRFPENATTDRKKFTRSVLPRSEVRVPDSAIVLSGSRLFVIVVAIWSEMFVRCLSSEQIKRKRERRRRKERRIS